LGWPQSNPLMADFEVGPPASGGGTGDNGVMTASSPRLFALPDLALGDPRGGAAPAPPAAPARRPPPPPPPATLYSGSFLPIPT
jgi:hypothetical protein